MKILLLFMSIDTFYTQQLIPSMPISILTILENKDQFLVTVRHSTAHLETVKDLTAPQRLLFSNCSLSSNHTMTADPKPQTTNEAHDLAL